MNQTKHQKEEQNHQDSFVLVSSNSLKSLEKKLDTILLSINVEKQEAAGIDGYLTEKEAMQQFKRSHTWFWEKRKSGTLQFSKVGKTIYYQKEQLLKLIQSKI